MNRSLICGWCPASSTWTSLPEGSLWPQESFRRGWAHKEQPLPTRGEGCLSVAPTAHGSDLINTLWSGFPYLVVWLSPLLTVLPGVTAQTHRESESCSVVSDSCDPHGLYLYSPWNSPGQNTGVGSLSLLQEIFPTQGSNLGLPHCRSILYQLSHKGSPLNTLLVPKSLSQDLLLRDP